MLSSSTGNQETIAETGLGPNPNPIATIRLAIEEAPITGMEANVPGGHIPGQAVDPQIVFEPVRAISL